MGTVRQLAAAHATTARAEHYRRRRDGSTGLAGESRADSLSA